MKIQMKNVFNQTYYATKLRKRHKKKPKLEILANNLPKLEENKANAKNALPPLTCVYEPLGKLGESAEILKCRNCKKNKKTWHQFPPANSKSKRNGLF